ncbi:MAG: 50S ribosomal protein L9 [Nitrospirae bacterium]|nr:MAG: 50S ribosomal protein L9 [Nitrospirota bacterium]
MQVILQENVEGLGYTGDILTVADGYARNYLIPRKKAIVANPRNLKMLEHLKQMTAKKANQELREFQDLARQLSHVTLTFTVQTGKDDKMFGSVTVKDIADELAARGFAIDRRKIQLAQSIKELGTFSVPIKLHREVTAEIMVSVQKQGTEASSPQPESSTSETESPTASPQEASP